MTREWERLRRSTNRKSVGLTFEYAPNVGSLFKERISYQGKVDKKNIAYILFHPSFTSTTMLI